MAQRRLAERPVMQLVGLDDDATVGSAPARSAPERLHEAAAHVRTWASRRPATAGVIAVVAVVLLAGGVAAGPHWLLERERARVLGPASFVGAVDSLRSVPEVPWTADVDGGVAPVLVGDVLVVTAGSVDAGDRRVVGLDAVTGATRWAVALGADPIPDAVACRSAGTLVTCVAGPSPAPDPRGLAQVPDSPVGVSTLWAIDPMDGAVRSQHPISGWVQATAAAGADLVVATYASGRLAISRIEPVTGRQVWHSQWYASGRTKINGRLRMVVAGGLVLVSGADTSVLLDEETGERPAPSTEPRVDETRLTADGTLVREHYRVLDSAIVARSSLSSGLGEPWLTAEGSVLPVDVSDGSSALTFTSDGLGVDGVRAYRAGADQQVWRTTTKATRVSVDVAGRVVVRSGGTLAGLDTSDGSLVWVRDLGAVSGSAVSDGRRVAVLSGGVDDHPVLVALDLADGGVEWRLPLPDGTSRVVRLGTQLYALGDDLLVALR
ncbi:PQQ-binding-like beta-propeller repeat protein [Cellulomonas sp. URHE0023]|uniref:outer membrane protein assembly factor BamB family protein n=1 Tax=Cellulomonas sp. URHE0023 TaxID=1380354 RepID=UPI000483FE26|nr:PQQ-binding-like beta-propeller repeat protein [Cellulomonas sp. URHE0023]